eukprot:2880772-Amphidinium_carterae.1
MGDAQRKYPNASCLGTVALGAIIACAASCLLIDGNVLQYCYPQSGLPGYTWALLDGALVTCCCFFTALSTKYIPSAVTGLLGLAHAVGQPCLVWLFLGERPLESTMIYGSVLCLTLVVHEGIAYYHASDSKEIECRED